VGRAGTSFQVFLDDNWVYGKDFNARPLTYSWNTPILIPLPSDVLGNSDHIRIGIFGLAGSHMTLESVYIGEYDQLTQLHRKRSLVQNDLSFAISVGAAFLALFSFFLWLASNREKQHLYGFFAAIALICANFNFYVFHPPLPQNLWQALAHVPLDWYCIFSVLWMAELKQNKNRFIQWLWVWGVLSTAIQPSTAI